MALGNDKMRIKLSPFSFQREGTVPDPEWAEFHLEREGSQQRSCVWQGIIGLAKYNWAINSQFFPDLWCTLKKFFLEWISQWGLRSKVFSLQKEKSSRKSKSMKDFYFTSFPPVLLSVRPAFLTFSWEWSPLLAVLVPCFSIPLRAAPAVPHGGRRGEHTPGCPWIPGCAVQELPAQMVNLNYLSPGRNEPLVPGSTRQECWQSL